MNLFTFYNKHVCYYQGNPTVAVYEFQRRHGIGNADTSQLEGGFLGFDDHHIVDMKTDHRAWVGYQELVNSANQIINTHYSQKPS